MEALRYAGSDIPRLRRRGVALTKRIQPLVIASTLIGGSLCLAYGYHLHKLNFPDAGNYTAVKYEFNEMLTNKKRKTEVLSRAKALGDVYMYDDESGLRSRFPKTKP